MSDPERLAMERALRRALEALARRLVTSSDPELAQVAPKLAAIAQLTITVGEVRDIATALAERLDR